MDASRLNSDEQAQAVRGLCIWQTAYGLPHVEYCKRKATAGTHYCGEHRRDARELYPHLPIPTKATVVVDVPANVVGDLSFMLDGVKNPPQAGFRYIGPGKGSAWRYEVFGKDAKKLAARMRRLKPLKGR